MGRRVILIRVDCFFVAQKTMGCTVSLFIYLFVLFVDVVVGGCVGVEWCVGGCQGIVKKRGLALKGVRRWRKVGLSHCARTCCSCAWSSFLVCQRGKDEAGKASVEGDLLLPPPRERRDLAA